MKIKLNSEQKSWFETNQDFDIVLLYNSCIVNDTLYIKEKDINTLYDIFTMNELFYSLSHILLREDKLNIIKPIVYNIYE